MAYRRRGFPGWLRRGCGIRTIPVQERVQAVSDSGKRLIIEPKLTSDLGGFEAPGRVRTMQEWGAIKRQAALYRHGLFESYREVQPMPAGVIDGEAISNAEAALLRHYSEADLANLTALSWWNKKFGVPVLVNKVTKREYMSYTDLVRPETLAAMARPTPTMGNCAVCRRPTCICPPGLGGSHE